MGSGSPAELLARKSLVGGPRKQGNKRENASIGDIQPGARLSRGGPSRLPKLSDAHVDASTNMMEKFFERANEIHSSIKTVLEQEGALSDEEIQARADKEGLEQLRKKFDDLEEKLEREAEEDENLPEGVERMIQGMIRLCRQMMVAAADKEAEFWSKMKQLEVQFYQMKSASADIAASLRDWVTAAFQTMNEIDLNAIGGSSDTLVDEPRAN